MSTTLVLRPCGINNFEWLVPGQGLAVGDSELLLASRQKSARLTAVIPAEQMVLRTVHFEVAEKKLLAQTIRYTLEEELIDDVDDLHFALGALGSNSAPLAIVSREKIPELLTPLQEQGLDIEQLVPELMLLPLQEHSWTLLVDEERWLVRYALGDGVALEADTCALALQLLLDQAAELPQALDVYFTEEKGAEAQRAAISNQLPELLRGIIRWHDDDYWAVLAQGLEQHAANNKPINFLQGAYARKLPWKKWWQQWRIAAILLLVATTLQLVTSYSRVLVLEKTNVELRTEIEANYRRVVPRGVVMDAEQQLRRKVSALKGATGTGFVGLLAQVSQELAAVEGVVLQNMNYTENQSELRLTLIAASFNDVETVRSALEKIGLKAELTGSSEDAGKTRAYLRIRN